MSKDETLSGYGFSWYGFYYWDKKVGQVIFQEHLPAQIDRIENEPQRVEMLFKYPKLKYPRQRVANIKMLIGVFDAQDLKWDDYDAEKNEVIEKYYEFLATPQETETQQPLAVWKYTKMIKRI